MHEVCVMVLFSGDGLNKVGTEIRMHAVSLRNGADGTPRYGYDGAQFWAAKPYNRGGRGVGAALAGRAPQRLRDNFGRRLMSATLAVCALAPMRKSSVRNA